MPIKNNLNEIFNNIINNIKNSAATAPTKIAVTAGTHKVKLADAEVKKSLKGKQMAMLVWEVIDGDCKGGKTKQYTIIDSYDEANPWKYATLVNAFEAYGVNLDSVCSVADSIEEAFVMATTKLAKKIDGNTPKVEITLTRKDSGNTDSNGRPIYRDFYNFKTEEVDPAKEMEAATTDNDDFVKSLESDL